MPRERCEICDLLVELILNCQRCELIVSIRQNGVGTSKNLFYERLTRFARRATGPCISHYLLEIKTAN
jgi:hypothetical protein